jgi:tyrosine-specific transport protein
MNIKLISGILMIVGTCIGGGMLALPLANAELGFGYSMLLLVVCWLIMAVSALLLLEVNMWFPTGSNIISMAKATLGWPFELLAWACYLLLLYALLAAYIAGGSDYFTHLLNVSHIPIPHSLTLMIYVGALAYCIYRGLHTVVSINRTLMFVKFGVYGLLVLGILPFIKLGNLSNSHFLYMTSGITVAITSFGYANIIPSLRSYFQDDVKQLRRTIIIGSLIPLICYILWDLAIMGLIPASGKNGLISILHAKTSTSDLVKVISLFTRHKVINLLANMFMGICLITSFLGISLGLSDFLADGLKIPKKHANSWIIYALTFLPPVLLVIFYPGMFVKALSYAGILGSILLILLPALMAWRGRYIKAYPYNYRFQGGKSVLIILIACALIIIVQGIRDNSLI